MKRLIKKFQRKKLYLFLLCLLFVSVLAACDRQDKASGTSTQPVQPVKAYAGTIIAMGNSLTAGLGVAEEEAYPAVLEEKLRLSGYNWQVINAGISGETSSGALSRINWIIAQQPDIVILETGANDGMRGIPIRAIRENISQAVLLLKEADIEVVLAGMQMLQNLGPDYTTQFAAVYPAVAKKQEVILIPFFLKEVAGTPSLNLPDFIHPTPEGHRIVAQTVYPFVVKAIQAKSPIKKTRGKSLIIQ
jgi:acyl-CoA thioesterase-1